MTEHPDLDLADGAAVADRRDEVVAGVEAHAGRIARELALLGGGDFGRESFRTEAGEWTVKYEAGDLEFLLFDPNSGGEVYVVSTKRRPDPAALARAMADYPAFVAAFNERVESLAGVLDGVSTEFPEVASTADVVAERDAVLDRIRSVADRMAGELRRHEGGDYGAFATRVNGSRWELKWEEGRTSYLRVGGEGGTYLLSQYQPPEVADVRHLAGDVGDFVEAFNEEIAALDGAFDDVSL